MASGGKAPGQDSTRVEVMPRGEGLPEHPHGAAGIGGLGGEPGGLHPRGEAVADGGDGQTMGGEVPGTVFEAFFIPARPAASVKQNQNGPRSPIRRLPAREVEIEVAGTAPGLRGVGDVRKPLNRGRGGRRGRRLGAGPHPIGDAPLQWPPGLGDGGRGGRRARGARSRRAGPARPLRARADGGGHEKEEYEPADARGTRRDGSSLRVRGRDGQGVVSCSARRR